MRKGPPQTVAVEGPAEMFRVLGHENRLRLLLLLVTDELSVGALETVSGIGQPALSQQLAILRKADLVVTRRAAKQVYYRVNSEAVRPTATILAMLGNTEAVPSSGPKPAGAQTPETSGSAAGFARML